MNTLKAEKRNMQTKAKTLEGKALLPEMYLAEK